MSVVLYWLAIRLYALAIRVATLFNHKAKLFIRGRKGLFAHIRYSLVDEKRPRIWMHCASLGEFEQGRPVLEKLREKYPSHAFVLTFFSPSGYEIRKNYEGADYVFYLPLDSAYNAARFVQFINPSLAIFVKYELWYFLLMRLAKKNVPTILQSAIFRKEQVFFKWYGWLHRRMLHAFTHIFVQDTWSQQMLNRIRIEHVSVGGDTRFDRVASAALNIEPVDNIQGFCDGHKVIVAGSTWPDDEHLLKQVLDKLPAGWKMIVVPHETDISHLKFVMELHDGDAVLWSRMEHDYYDQRVLLVDTIGLLLRLYQYADIAYVGGGFNKSGIHNILEAAVYGKPVFHGPVYHKFKEAKDLQDCGAAYIVTGADSVYSKIIHWEKDRISYNAACISARKYVAGHTGATDKILDYIEGKELLNRL
jgi:3-deoxy-D-manno-octulosonic-acid transferase